MPGIVALVSAVSADVVSSLAAAGLPPLTDGAILLGAQHVKERSSPPRIVAVPSSAGWGPAVRLPSAGDTTERRTMIAERSLMTEIVHLDFYCWGASVPETRDGDYDATQILYQQVIRSLFNVLGAASDRTWLPTKGAWTDSSLKAAQLITAGRAFTFGVEIRTPVPDQLLPYAPPGTAANNTTQLQPADGSAPGIGCTG